MKQNKSTTLGALYAPNFKPQQRVVGWPRCYYINKEVKTTVWKSLRNFLF